MKTLRENIDNALQSVENAIRAANSDLGIARDELLDARDKAPEDCECNGFTPGIRWPCAINGDRRRGWIERCDACGKYESDEAAAAALARLLGNGISYRLDYVFGAYSPYIDVGNGPL